MEKSKVYFTDMRAGVGSNMLQKMERIVREAGIDKIDFKDKLVAVKIHFGEYGNMAYIRPNYAAVIVKIIRDLGGKPFLTDSNTLYSGSRSNAVDHLHTAMVNGFNLIATGCDVVIADGLRGKDERAIDVNGEFCKAPLIGAAIAEADIVVSMTHFKGHEMAGFGGTIKNLGMGSGSVAGKQEMHSTAQPKVELEKCIGCKICEKNCAHEAIKVVDKKAVIDYNKCLGCGQCVALCKNEGVVMGSTESGIILNYKIVEYTEAVLKDKPNFHVSFIMNVSPECDCWAHNDAAIVPDLGIAASFDPVALDQACADLVNAAPMLKNNMLHDKHEHEHEGECHHDHATECDHQHDKFHVMHPDTNWQIGLEYAEKRGMGTREYELIKL
ncbi:MAG: DUF362 domain-containing protein [Paludibacteraceae bacterium]|nr:DUF362 domain-containing protein [Paludibacteraceae bacterium]